MKKLAGAVNCRYLLSLLLSLLSLGVLGALLCTPLFPPPPPPRSTLRTPPSVANRDGTLPAGGGTPLRIIFYLCT